jgi:hypothetical protein
MELPLSQDAVVIPSTHLVDDVAELYRRMAINVQGGRHQVTFHFEAGKVHAGELGEEEKLPLRDWIEIGAWGFGEDPLHLEKHPIEEGQRSVTFVVDQYPERVATNPRHALIDRHPDENEVKVTAAPAVAAAAAAAA